MRDYQQPQMPASILEIVAIIEPIEICVDIHTSAAADASLDLGQIHRGIIFASTATAACAWDYLLFIRRHSSIEILF